MIILKLGGSVITNKTKVASFKKEVVDDLSREIKRANKQLIIIHGAGSFGHIYAKKYIVLETPQDKVYIGNQVEVYERKDRIKFYAGELPQGLATKEE